MEPVLLIRARGHLAGHGLEAGLGRVVEGLCAAMHPDVLAEAEWVVTEAPVVQAAYWPKAWA